MSALAGLSVAANVFQIVDFAGAVFSARKNLYELFDKARSASSSITLLLQELQRLLSIVAYIHVVITEHASSPFTHALPNVQTILTLINKDIEYLKDLTGTAQSISAIILAKLPTTCCAISPSSNGQLEAGTPDLST
jgi:hypothetical protein